MPTTTTADAVKAAVGADVRMVCVQFSFTNEAAVPKSLIRYAKETNQESASRKMRTTGMQVVPTTQNVSVGELLNDLTSEKYALVDALYQRRIGGNQPSGQYNTVRFTFCRIEKAVIHPVMNALWDGAIAGFNEICEMSFWRVRVFNNPYFDGKDNEVEGERALSINCEARTPRFEGGNRSKPVLMRLKDENGHKVDPPVALRQSFDLRIPEGGEVTLFPVSSSVG